MSDKAKMTKDVVPEGFTVSLAIIDALPGLFFGVFTLLTCPLYAYSGTRRREEEQPSLPEPQPQEEEKDILPAEIVEPAKPAPSLPEPTVVDVEAEVQKEDEPATPPAP